MPGARADDLERIRRALDAAGDVLAQFSPTTVGVREKPGGSPVTDADLAVDAALRATLPVAGEGWLSEESDDDPARLACRVWVVDPLDGTREWLAGSDEWCVAIGLVEDGVAVAGGILAPAVGERYLGAAGVGTTVNGTPVTPSARTTLDGAVAIVGRWPGSATRRRVLAEAPFALRAVGAAAYQLALVAAGRGDAVWSRGRKAEWDVCAGVALIAAAGGHVATWEGGPLAFNSPEARVPSLVACAPRLRDPLHAWLAARLG
jgi:myo-inositol-1(or 4)-monophosphatase